MDGGLWKNILKFVLVIIGKWQYTLLTTMNNRYYGSTVKNAILSFHETDDNTLLT